MSDFPDVIDLLRITDFGRCVALTRRGYGRVGVQCTRRLKRSLCCRDHKPLERGLSRAEKKELRYLKKEARYAADSCG